MSRYVRGRRSKKIDLASQRDKLLTVLARDINRLMTSNVDRQMSDEESMQVCKYLKLLKELEAVAVPKTPDVSLADMSDEALEAKLGK